ncbi:hypothetical protein K0H71_00415 [Bacillus sp. IITD106]|nr:hypothetical protein [Bacillus sp. IITD106]
MINNYANTPINVFGRGSIHQVHSINEYVPIDEHYQSIEILAGVIAEWCG